MAKPFRNGDVEITKCQLSSLDGSRSLNVLGQVSFINIFESVIQPMIVGDVVFTDAIGLLNNFPLIGEEIFEITFKTPTYSPVTYKLNVYMYDQFQISDNNKSVTFTGHLISNEGLVNNTRSVSKRFNQQISSSVSQILTEYLKTTDTLDIEPTLGIDNILLSNLSPLQVIDALRHRAISPQFKSSSYVCYQDRSGWHFKSLEQMLSTSGTPALEYKYDSGLDHDITEGLAFTDIVSYMPVKTTNTLEKLQFGGTTNRVKRFDILTGQTTDVAYSDSSDLFKKTGDISKEQSSTFNQMYGQSTGSKSLVSYGENTPETLNEKASLLPGFVNRINQNIVNIAIYGNSELLVGMPLITTIVEGVGTTNSQSNYRKSTSIITKIRHIIQISDRPVYSQSLELIGNSYAK
jgi:hypothetical protein